MSRRPRRHRSVTLLLVLLFLLVPFAALATGSFTLEQIRTYAFPQDLIVAPDSEQIAWIKNDAGRYNVWVASAPDFKPKQLTAYARDDGQEISSLALSDDGRRLVYVRGGEHDGNWGRTLPINPTSSPVATKVEIYGMNVADRAPRRLAEGDYPALSPDGRRVAFIKNDAAWIVPFEGEVKARRLFTTRGRVGSLAWSPDSRRLAFVASRESHAFVGIYQDDATPILWLAPDAARDGSPVWSPDGRQVAFVRSPGDGGAPKPSLQLQPKPWSIWIADAATGRGMQRWVSGEGLRDSLIGGSKLHWADGGSLVFRSYQDGWQHLYALPPDGDTARLLTPGDYMVEHYSLSADRRHIIYDANTGPLPDDIDRRHLYRVAVDGARPPEPLTSGTGIETFPLETAGGRVLFFSADAQRPPQLAMLHDNGIRLLDPSALPKGYPLKSPVTPRRVTFQAEDGMTVHGQLFEPKKVAGKRPAVVYIHGGPQRQMLLGWHYMDYYSNDYAVNQYLASQGYVVLAVNYRLGPGYGHDYHFPPEAGVRGASEYRDIRAAGRYLQSLPDVDANLIGVYGGSYGGYLTAMALAHDSSLFRVGVDVHGLHNRVANMSTQTRYQSPPDAEEAMAIAWRSSPVSAVATWKSPVLFIHGDDDRNVKFGQTVDLIQRLRGTGVHHETLVLVDETHSIHRHGNVLRMNDAVVEFLRRYLDR